MRLSPRLRRGDMQKTSKGPATSSPPEAGKKQYRKGGGGVREMMEEIFNLYYRDVYSYLYSICRDAALAEDLASETFLEALRTAALFRGEADIKTWLFTIARRRWFSHLRQKKRRVPAAQSLSEWLADSGPDVAEHTETRALAARAAELLQREPERTRGIVNMRVQGYSFYEIGVKFGVSENSARVIDFRARAKIRKLLKEEGFWDE